MRIKAIYKDYSHNLAAIPLGNTCSSTMYRLLILLFYSQCCYGQLKKWDVFSMTTAYEWANDVSNPTKNPDFWREHGGQACHVFHVNILTRHGLRYPFQDEVQQITNLQEKLLTLPDGLNYRNRLTWGSNYTLEQAETLTRSGEIEQFKLGARTGLRYSALLENSVRQLNVVSSTRKRNRQSSTSFIKCVKNSAVIFGGCKITLTDRFWKL